ncbi:MAG: aromatic ring-hydroxylating dioxygenase subunit alpha [Actinobacteria bacterium]|nr:aromatic ring-hydroxylating dioxygenase subunit alpha [Actinomycetota bacterium]
MTNSAQSGTERTRRTDPEHSHTPSAPTDCRDGGRVDAVLEDEIRKQLAANRERTGPPTGAVEIPPIPTGRYCDPEFVALERDRVWRRSWLYAGHLSQLPEQGSYLTTDRSGSPVVVVRGEDDVVRAFYNSCRHRAAPVVRDECGTARRLTCHYHSWSYGLAGELRAVPDSRNFVDLDESSLELVPVRCEAWEGFVFVNEDPSAPSLETYLGPLAEQMREIDGTRLRWITRQHHHVAANWKVVVDAFLEVYHIRTVHPDNAALLYDDSTVTVAMLPNGHSRLSVAVRPELLGVMDPSPAADNPSVGALRRETSTSFGWFPNVVAPLDTGAFPLLCIWPVDTGHADPVLEWFAPDWGTGDMPDEHALRVSLFETVMAQDTANLGAIQRSVESPGARPFQIGWHERLVHHFHRAVDLAIGPEDVPGGLAVSDTLDRFVDPA